MHSRTPDRARPEFLVLRLEVKLLCHPSTCLRIGSKLRCIRSTPTEMQSIRENDFECFASTGVNTPGTMLPSVSSPPLLHVTLFIPRPAALIPPFSHQAFKYTRPLRLLTPSLP